MAKSNKIRFFLLVAFFTFAILPAQGLEVTVKNVNGYSVINEKYDRKEKCWKPKINGAWRMPGTSTVIFYANVYMMINEVMAPTNKNKILEIQNELATKKYALFYLLLDDYKKGDDDDIISTFIQNRITQQQGKNIENIEMIGQIKKTFAKHDISAEHKAIVRNVWERLDEMIPEPSASVAVPAVAGHYLREMKRMVRK